VDIIVSDVHLGSKKNYNYLRFLEFLEYVYTVKPSNFIILGDLFEFLYSPKYIIRKYKELFEKLYLIKKEGTKIYYLYGNHDFNFKIDGLTCVEKLDNFKIQKFDKALIFHGDGLDPKDKNYRIFRSIVRSDFFSFITKFIPDALIYKGANLLSKMSRIMNNKRRKEISFYTPYREYALNLLKNENYDLIIFAHTHFSEIIEESGKFYVNSGSFAFFGDFIEINGNNIKISKF
jgi:UDP-2,3-diacylglucosamine hydrolase